MPRKIQLSAEVHLLIYFSGSKFNTRYLESRLNAFIKNFILWSSILKPVIHLRKYNGLQSRRSGIFRKFRIAGYGEKQIYARWWVRSRFFPGRNIGGNSKSMHIISKTLPPIRSKITMLKISWKFRLHIILNLLRIVIVFLPEKYSCDVKSFYEEKDVANRKNIAEANQVEGETKKFATQNKKCTEFRHQREQTDFFFICKQ